ncbi:MAG TPA: hypothetical protein VJT09_11315 [Pyrinomonadaceae bacterium]|nr:hypothetical protein [Pyrinomonadaceae bacterium]
MCYFVTATLPYNVKVESVASVFESHTLGFELISNPHVSAQVEPGDLYVLTTRGYCDCDTALGLLNPRDNFESVSYERELKKFRKQGWSEAKIQRWLEEKEQAKERYMSVARQRAEATAPEAGPWVDFIAGLLRSGYTPRIGLLLHMYSGSVSGERVNILGREKVGLRDLNSERLLRMKEDVLYEFVS